MNYRRACRLAHRALQLARPRPVSLSAHPASQRTLSTPAPGSLSDVDEHDDFADFGRYSIILPPEPHVFGVSHIRPRRVPAHIARPPYVTTPPPGDGSDGDPRIGDGTVALGSVEERKLRAAAQLAKQVLDYAGSLVKPGVMTDKIDAQVHEYIIVRGAYPSPLLYSGFPKSCCTSVNNIIAHGIPDGRPLENGDIVNIDITVYLEGYHGDTSRTFLVGDVDNYGRELVAAATAALDAGISVCGPGRPFRAIGAAIHDALLRAAAASRTEAEYSVSPLFTGHGIGTTFHRPPWIVHERNDEPGTMRPGQCFTIEPCIVQGADPSGWIFPDGWTASTENAARSAQAEHMVLITETGADVLTR